MGRLGKITKEIAKGKTTIHPKGRKFAKLNKAHLRDHKLEHKKKQHMDKREHELQRLLFFQEAAEVRLKGDKQVFSKSEVKDLIIEFISRFDQELSQLKSQRRPGRPPSKRQDLVQNQKDIEENEFETGFKVPVMWEVASIEKLLKWNRTIGGRIDYGRVGRND